MIEYLIYRFLLHLNPNTALIVTSCSTLIVFAIYLIHCFFDACKNEYSTPVAQKNEVKFIKTIFGICIILGGMTIITLSSIDKLLHFITNPPQKIKNKVRKLLENQQESP